MQPSAPSSLLDRPGSGIEYPKASGPLRQETFYVDEGPITLTFPASLSATSYADLKDYLDLFLRKAKRQADKEGAQRLGRDPDEE
jgi:hypothetical protein